MEKSRIVEVVERLRNANEMYRRGTPVMSDEEYDAWEAELELLDPDNDWFKRGVNDEKPKTRKVKLPFPMMSLNKVKTIQELIVWAETFDEGEQFVITPKLDGLSVGFFTGVGPAKAFTRGDGEIGQDCTSHFFRIGQKPDYLKMQKGLCRGEIIFKNVDFEKFKTRHEEAKNSRNSATGLINGDFDMSKSQDYSNLSVVCYKFSDMEKWLDKKQELVILHDATAEDSRIPYVVCTIDDLKAEDCKMTLLKLFNDWRKVYPMDGLVFDVNSARARSLAGVYANGNPKHSIAYKDPDFTERAIVKVDHLELQLNREGVVTPVIEFTMPVNLSGADIKRVNGINMQYIHDWGIFDGQFLTIVRSGEVIPKITQVNGVTIPFREEFKSDKAYKKAYQEALDKRHEQIEYKVFKDLVDVSVWKCPFCLCELQWDENHVQMICPGTDCREKKLQGLVAFCKICGMKDFGEESIRQLFKAGKVYEIEDLFDKVGPGTLMTLPGWGQASIDAFLGELTRIQTTLPYAQIAHATGYFGGLGQKTIQMILDSDLIEEIEGGIKEVSVEQLCTIPGVQEKTAKQFIEGARVYSESKLIHFMCPSYVKTPKKKGGILSGEIVCFTGFRSKELKERIESEGGQVVESLTKKTTLLLTKEEGEESTKTKKAQEWGIKVTSVKSFEQNL